MTFTQESPARDLAVLIGGRIALLRGQTGTTQEALAEAIGLTRSSVANMEAGRHGPTVGTLLAIAEHFGLTVDALLTGRACTCQPNRR